MTNYNDSSASIALVLRRHPLTAMLLEPLRRLLVVRQLPHHQKTAINADEALWRFIVACSRAIAASPHAVEKQHMVVSLTTHRIIDAALTGAYSTVAGADDSIFTATPPT